MERQSTPQLSEIADSYHCDKGQIGPSPKFGANNYADIYQAYLYSRRLESLTLLEIGLGVSGENWDAKIVQGGNSDGGASIKMWQDYLPNSRIIGVDINPAKHLETAQIETHVVDQGDLDNWKEFLTSMGETEFDIVIDDGSHRADHQQLSLEVLFPRLKSGGLYFIEDLNDSGFNGSGKGRHATHDTYSTRDFFKAFNADGSVLEPNKFSNTDFLAGIENVFFHSPRPVQRSADLMLEAIRFVTGRAKKGLLRNTFNPDSPKMVVLQKS